MRTGDGLLISMTCGRCGQKTAPGSNYCPRCRWTLFTDQREGRDSEALLDTFESPHSASGFLEKRRIEHQQTSLQKSLRAQISAQTARLEALLENDPRNFALQRELGGWCLIDNAPLRAVAHLESAHKLQSDDLETNINLGIARAKIGRLSSALELLQSSCNAHPKAPLPLFNFATVALQARHYEMVLAATQRLEVLCAHSESVAAQYRAPWHTLRGLALHGLSRREEARDELESAAREVAENAAHADDQTTVDHTREADTLNNLALVELSSKETERAIARWMAALQIEPGHARVLNNLGALACEQGKFEVAHKYLELASQIENFTGQIEPSRLSNLGVVLAARGESELAQECFAHAGQHERAEFEVFYNLGRAHIEWGRPDKGIEALRHAFARNAQHADVHTVLGAAYLLRGQENGTDEAIKHLRRAAQLDTHHKCALLDLTLALLEINNCEGAQKLLNQVLKIHPHSTQALFMSALLTMQQSGESNWATAGGQLVHLYENRRDLLVCLYNAALCQFLLGFREASANQLQIVVDRDDSFAPAYYLIGLGHATANRLDEALVAWQKAVIYEPKNVDLQASLGFAYYQKENWKLAIKHYMAAHQLVPDDANLLSALGISFARNKMYVQAVTAFTQSLVLDSTSPITHSNIGLAYYLQDQVEISVQHWRIVSQLDRSYSEQREEEQYRNFDDSQIALRPLRWRERMIFSSPALPPPHTRFLPGFNAWHLRPSWSDESLAKAWAQREELDHVMRRSAWMHVHFT